MQRQRINLQLVCEFDPGSSSSTPSMDHHNSLLDPIDTQHSPSYHGNLRQENPSYDICNSSSSSSKHATNEGYRGEAEMEHMLMHSLSDNLEGGSMIETDSLPLENINLNLGINRIDHGQPSLQHPNLPNNADHVAMSTQELGPGLSPLPCHAGLLTPDQILLSNASWNTFGNSSGSIGAFSEHDRGEQSGELESRRTSRKRTVDGMLGQPSASTSSGFVHQNRTSSLSMPGSSHNTGLLPPIEQLTHGIDTITAPLASVQHFSASAQASSGGFPRNTRMRTNLHQNDILSRNMLLQGSSSSHSHRSHAHQQYYSSIPAYQLDESRLIANVSSSNSQPLAVPGVLALIRNMHPFQLNGTADSRAENSLISGVVGEEGSNQSFGSMSARNNPNQMLLVPSHNMNNLVSSSPTRHFTNGTRRIHIGAAPTPQAGNNAGAHHPVGSSFIPRQFPSSQNHRILSEIVWRSVSSSQQDGSHGQQPHLRQALWADRHNDGLLGVPLSMPIPAARRDIRSRMLLEDILILEQSGAFGTADLHDRHRDMRLDVDNMSYEELLALEERIGNVSTGLSEETITKFLRRRRYISISPLTLEEVEPCCICREEYVEGEEVGRLDCGHDFHSACIEHWLFLKNLCPICRTTALGATTENG